MDKKQNTQMPSVEEVEEIIYNLNELIPDFDYKGMTKEALLVYLRRQILKTLEARDKAWEQKIEEARREERERILKVQYAKPVSTNPMYNTGFNDAVARIFTAIRKLTPTNNN